MDDEGFTAFTSECFLAFVAFGSIMTISQSVSRPFCCGIKYRTMVVLWVPEEISDKAQLLPQAFIHDRPRLEISLTLLTLTHGGSHTASIVTMRPSR